MKSDSGDLTALEIKLIKEGTMTFSEVMDKIEVRLALKDMSDRMSRKRKTRYSSYYETRDDEFKKDGIIGEVGGV